MQPSARQIVSSIRHGLQTQVRVATDDPVVLSVLRSVDGLLAHLAVRLEHEAEFLVEDNRAARALLGLPHTVEIVLSTDELTRRNDELRQVIDDRLAGAYHRSDGAEVARIEEYLARRLDAEQAFFVPAFAAGTY